jgi:hypothetical protein
MTQAQTRGRGKPRAFDEDQLLDRVRSIEDLIRVRDALEANGEGRTAVNAFGWLAAKWAGDPSGGVDRRSATVYRAALARLPSDPIGNPRRRRNGRIVPPGQHGGANLRLVGTAAGAGALALAGISPAHALELAAACVTPIILLM